MDKKAVDEQICRRYVTEKRLKNEHIMYSSYPTVAIWRQYFGPYLEVTGPTTVIPRKPLWTPPVSDSPYPPFNALIERLIKFLPPIFSKTPLMARRLHFDKQTTIDRTSS